MKRIYN